MSVSSPDLRKVLGTWRTLPTLMLAVVIVDYRGGWTENVPRDALFSLLGTNQNVLWDTNDFNIDSIMGTKKMSTVFRNSCLSQLGVIVDAKVSDRQRRCWAPCRNVIGYKSSFTCHVLLGSCLLSCWVLFKVRSLLWSLHYLCQFELTQTITQIFYQRDLEV